MKVFIAILILNISVLVLCIKSNFWEFSPKTYISEQVLEKSIPFNVTIDVDFLKSLDPAYEQ